MTGEGREDAIWQQCRLGHLKSKLDAFSGKVRAMDSAAVALDNKEKFWRQLGRTRVERLRAALSSCTRCGPPLGHIPEHLNRTQHVPLDHLATDRRDQDSDPLVSNHEINISILLRILLKLPTFYHAPHRLSGQCRLYSSCSAASSSVSCLCSMNIMNSMSKHSTAKAIRVENTKSLMGDKNIL